MKLDQRQVQHLYWRAGFGAPLQDVQAATNKDSTELVNALFEDSKTFDELQEVSKPPRRSELNLQQMSLQEKRQMLRQTMGRATTLNIAWLQKMSTGKSMLREKMTFFWHNHFACKVLQSYYVQQQNNVLRKNALGNFHDLLFAISKDAAMLQFLNNQQNKKEHPNENFAREVMELFTMGRGNYSEDDVKNAARAFTGWQHDQDGNFRFNSFEHDNGSKTFLGKTGHFNGDDILNIILDEPQASAFITKKIYRHFVNETPEDEIVSQLSKSLYESHYDLTKLMNEIFVSDWFYDEKNIGTHVKSPVELIVGMQRTLPVQLNAPQALLREQRLLGQLLFYPPSVAGWPLGKSWIDSASLLMRMKLPENIFAGAEITGEPKPDQDEVEQMMMHGRDRMSADDAPKPAARFNATADWTALHEALKNESDDAVYSVLKNYILQPADIQATDEYIQKQAGHGTREKYIENLTTQLMSLPEYQLC
jgi:uncharacterized protein (DUF1800 family)